MTRSNRSAANPPRAHMRLPALGLALGCCMGGLAHTSCDKPDAPPLLSKNPRVQALDELSTSQRRVFLKGCTGDWRANTAMARGQTEPPAALPVPPDSKIIDLPAAAAADMPLNEAITRRRSRRDFTADPLTLPQLSFLLASTQGVTHSTRDDSSQVTFQFRATPSGGGRYPLETFLAVQRVEGLAPGIYRYLPPQHQLLLVRTDCGIASLQRACYGDASVGAAAATFIWAAVPERSEWKYGCIAQKLVAIEAGHVCQNLYLASEAIGAGTCAMLSYDQPSLDTLIGADGNDVFAIYLAVVGKPGDD
jgi:SagB-type dehydrogenase family enzyme